MGVVVEDLIRRFRNLEASKEKLWEQLDFLIHGDGGGGRNHGEVNRKMTSIEGNFIRNPYQVVLEQLGHALHICKPISGVIIYWNRSAENLYGWKSYEALGQKVTDLLIDVKWHPCWESSLERVYSGQTWSGQFPFRKRSGELLMALLTMSPLYDNGDCIGVIAVSNDASMLNNANSERTWTNSEEAGGLSRETKSNFKRIHWSPQLQIASSVSNLAGKFLAQLNIRGNASSAPEMRKSPKANSTYISADTMKHVQGPENSRESMKDTAYCDSFCPNVVYQRPSNNVSEMKIKTLNENCSEQMRNLISRIDGSTSFAHCHDAIIENTDLHRNGGYILEDPLKQATVSKLTKMEDLRHSKYPNPVETSGSSQSCSSTIGEVESNLVADSEIHWEDLLLGEKVGEGSYAVVYRGVWNGSNVAIKVYTGMEYRESVLLDYKKEVAIMKKLRHPNVLLFMGAVYSPEHLAIVTEYLPRGSLFSALHKNNQSLVFRRRLRMALDVARGMNYLHRRNPPIIHRDLKSSNLLVDRNWTVKVGDFGLSCLKISTVITAKSGRGTPQWMAPEVLRGEFSSEKSDVFSFGVILWELMTESVPWRHLDSMQVVGVVGFMDRRLDIPEEMDSRVAAIISDCWGSDPLLRPSFQILVERMTNLTGTVSSAAPTPDRRRLEQPAGVSLPDC